MKQWVPIVLRNWLKKYGWRWVYYQQLSSAARAANDAFMKELEAGTTTGSWNMFTREGEDGILLRIFHHIGTTNKQFVDIGSNDGINSNCANLALHQHWNGIFIDADKNALDRGRYIYQQYLGNNSNRFRFVNGIISIYNAETLLRQQDCVAEPDLLCIDLDGNDYHIWQSIQHIQPRVVVTEVQIEKGSAHFIPRYQQEFEAFEDGLPKGASPASMIALARQKGYTLVAANEGRYNLFFVRNDCRQNLPELHLQQLLVQG